MKRVLFILNASSGGATLSALDLMQALRSHGVESFAIAPLHGAGPGLEKVRRIASGVELVPLPWWNKNYKAKLWKRPLLWGYDALQSRVGLRTIRGITHCIEKWKVDLVHTNTALTLHPALACKLTRTPHVWHIREPIGRDELIRFALPDPWTARTFVELADAVVVNSRATRTLFDKNGVRDKVHLIYNGIQLEKFANGADAGAVRRAWGVSGSVPVIGMVAHLTARWKEHEVFVRAAARIAQRRDDVRFVIVGKDPDVEGGYKSELAYARQLKRTASDLGLNGRLLFAGARDDVPAVMKAMDILVHPATQESFGRVVVEAMAASKPVVGPTAGGVGEIVRHGHTGLSVDGGDSEQFADACLSLLAKPEWAAELGQNGRTVARDNYSIGSVADRVARLYGEIV